MILLLLFFTLSFGSWCPNQFPKDEVPYYPSKNVTELCQNGNFAVLYDVSMLNPAWTSIYLEYKLVKNDQGGRKRFTEDPRLEKQASVTSQAFKEPFNHGHLVESYIVSYDKSDDGPWHDCYYMSNISPQYGIFNQVCWAKLENKTRDFIISKKIDLYMITGVAYLSRSSVKRIDNVAIPDFFFKVLCTSDSRNGIGFYGVNEGEISWNCLKKYSIKDIEKIYGGKISDCPYNMDFWEDF